MKAAVIIGSIGAVILASPKAGKRSPAKGHIFVDPLENTKVARPGSIFQPEIPLPLMDSGPYCVVDAVLSHCARELHEIGRIGRKAARSMPANRVFRRQLCGLVLASPFNDILYGERPMAPARDTGPHGRSISMSAKHANNLALMREGKPLVRTIDSRGRVVVHGHASPPAIWIPLISLEDLAQGTVTTAGYEYEDGSSTIVPPPPIMGLV